MGNYSKELQNMSNELKNALIELNKATQKIIEISSELESSENVIEVCKFFKELGEHLENLEYYQKELKAIYEKFSTDVIPDILEAQKLGNSVKLFNRTFILNVRGYFSIPEAKQSKGFPWVEANGLGPLIKEAVNSNSLSSAISEIIEEKGTLPPEDCVSMHVKKYITIRKT